MVLFTFDKVTKRYHYTKEDVFTDLSFSINSGETLTVLAQIQSGKSTLAKLLMGLEKPTSGQITFCGQPYKIAPKDKGIAYLCEQPLLFSRKSVLYNLAYPLLVRKTPKEEAYALAQAQAEKYGFAQPLLKVSKLSAEQSFALTVARADMRPLNLVIADGLSGVNCPQAVTLATSKGCALLILTENVANASGKVLVIYKNTIGYCGDASSAKEFVSNLLWLDENYINTLNDAIQK